MRIFALDPGLSTGWAHFGRVWGVQVFQKRPWRHPFAHYLDFRAWLVRHVERLRIDALAYEGAFSFARKNGNASRMEWQGVIHSVAAEMDIPAVGIMPNVLKKYATGDGRSEKPDLAIALAQRFGIQLDKRDYDAMEAIWVLSWATREAEEGRIVKDWSGYPGNRFDTRGRVCNACCEAFESGTVCPKCMSRRVRLEA